MTKEKKILLYFVSFILGLLTIMLVGISDVFALTSKTIYSGISGNSLTGSGYYNYGYINAGGVQSSTTGAVGSTISGVSYGFQFYYYEDVILNNTYTLKINFKSNDLLKTVNSNYFNIQVCGNNDCSNAIIISLEKSSNSSNSNWVIVKFNPVDIGSIISVDIGGDNSEALTGVENFGISSIQTEYSNANQDIIDNNNNNTNNIIDNNNNNTQNIIDSVESTIKDTFIGCSSKTESFDASNIVIDDKVLNENGQMSDSTYYGITDYIPLSKSSSYSLSSNYNGPNNVWFCIYNDDKSLSRCIKFGGLNQWLFTTNQNESYLRLSINTDLSSYTLTLLTEKCSNKIDETNEKLDDLNNNLTDSSPTDVSSLQDSAGWLPPGPVDSIINLPLTFFLNLSESLGSECRPVELTLPFVDEKIYLPCVRSLYDKMGVTGTIFTTAGVIASAVILFNYLLALYKWVDDTLTLRENTMPGYYEDKWGGGA